ncbi:hypothetical protein BDZ85DRAFT_267208 [Elsinoe ampelina]|uniref:Secreted protein n=1 Tax=Elsinoe ampelina TaxID=302913 RepID=A0A6A6G316_9PEZI|nr:hypothetical protein BDZ85DRAFT_267208 [Elsinoe ampelina]
MRRRVTNSWTSHANFVILYCAMLTQSARRPYTQCQRQCSTQSHPESALWTKPVDSRRHMSWPSWAAIPRSSISS